MATLLLTLTACEQGVPQLGKNTVDDVVAAMTLNEKVTLLIGTGMAGFMGDSAVVGETQSLVPGAAGTTHPIPRLGIPAIVLADGPAGLRISPTREGTNDTYYCTAFPVATLLASTWNTDLVEHVGKAMGNEVLEYGVDVLLAPALNIHRNPLCGRNFEYYSEDPLLAGLMASAMTKGVQSNGVGVSLKHFAANNQETNRMGNDSRVSERALREIYLKGFEIAVKEANPWTVMSSYNKINGTYASESRTLLTDILRSTWNFEGVVMTDWFGGRNPADQVHAGNDLLMPGRAEQGKAIIAAIEDGTLSVEDVDVNVKRILNLILETPRFKGYAYSNKPNLEAHAQITRNSATEGMVLLENKANTLPLQSGIKTVAAYGITSYDFIAGGTGSGDVNEAYTVSLFEGLENAGYTIEKDVESLYENHIQAENEKNKPDESNPLAAFLPKNRPSEFVPTTAQLAQHASRSDVALITIGRNSGEFADRVLPGDFELTDVEQQLIKAVTQAFHKQGKKAIVILNIGGVIETASWKAIPDAILLAWQAGQESGNSVADVLTGKVNPSGRLPMTFPNSYWDVPSANNFPYEVLADQRRNLMGGDEASAKEVKNIDYTDYTEGIFVGYRYYETDRKLVSYPFGYGLSYSTFEYTNPTIKQVDKAFECTIDVKNIGTLSGKAVVQLYVAAPENKALAKPLRELRAFAKTSELQPGTSETITLRVNTDALASYDEHREAWVVDKGLYQFCIGQNAHDMVAQINISVN
jgi:beta-glucosidase